MPDQTFTSLRAATRWQQGFAMRPPKLSGVSTAAAYQAKDFKAKFGGHAGQADAYRYVTEIGELGYVISLIAATVAKGRLVVVETDEHGTVVQAEKNEDGTLRMSADREKAQRVLDAFRGPSGDHRAIMADAAVHDQTGGEALLYGEPVKPPPGSKPKRRKSGESGDDGISWEMLSVFELVKDKQSGQLQRKRSASSASALSVASGNDDAVVDVDPDTYIARYHRRALAYSGDATSPVLRNASVCREITRWDQLIDTTIMSRLSAALMLVPEEVSFPADDQYPEDVDEADRFLELLVEHVSAPIEDPSSKASIAPLIARVPAEMIEKFRLMSLTDGSLDLAEMREARQTALRRLAAGIDYPLEVMEGMGSTSHWNASGIDTDSVKKHIVPLGERLARFFTVSYFRRMLIAGEEMDEDTAERFELAYDGSDILTRMDAAKSADGLHADILISDDARVEAHGFDPDQVRPDEAERVRRLIERLALVPDKGNRPMLAALAQNWAEELGLPPELVEEWLKAPVVAAPPAPSAVVEEPEEPDDGEPIDDAGPAVPATGEPEPDDDSGVLVIQERIRTAAAMALDRALEKAANRVCTQSKKLTAETKARVDLPDYRRGPRKPEVLRLVTTADWAKIDDTPDTLLKGAFDEFADSAVEWLRGLYEDSGRDPLAADEDARRHASNISNRLNDLALRAFKQPLPREDGLSVPLALIVDCCPASVR